MNAYIFVAAAVFSVIPILVVLKVNINKLIEHPANKEAIQKQFLIGVALSKIIPVILMLFGIIKLTKVTDMSQLYLAWGIILLVVLGAVLYIFKQKKLDLKGNVKEAVNALIAISTPLVFTIPFMAVAFMFLMTI